MHVDQKSWILKHFAAIINIVNPGTVYGFFQMNVFWKKDRMQTLKEKFIYRYYLYVNNY